LRNWSSGADPAALDQLMPLVYGELRKIAARQFRRETPGNTLQSTALVHEAYLKLVDQQRVEWQDRDHFFAVAAQMIRRILVNKARERKAEKRGGGQAKLLFDEALGIPGRGDVDLVALDDALTGLAKTDEQQARIVELRFFAGLSVEATAKILGISASTVKRDWVIAKGWLFRELSRGGSNVG
jgi:RNA polymerase sigma factor (TIGR02999 family)